MKPWASSLKHRAFKASGWAIGGFVFGQALRLGGNLIFTRLLFPEAFGLMAVVYVLHAALALLSDMGITLGIIRDTRNLEADCLNTSWTIQILRGCLIGSVMVLVALMLPVLSDKGWVSDGSVYAAPLLPKLMVVYSLAVIITGFESTKVAEARRKLVLGSVIKIDLLSQCVAMVVMIWSAWIYPSVWVLVTGAVVSSLVRCVLGHLWLPGVPNRFCWEPSFVRQISHFGIRITMLSSIGFIGANGDRLIMGNLVDSATLGIYSIAFLLSHTVYELFNSMMTPIVLPAFSEVLRQRPQDLSKLYFRIQGAADLFLFGAAAFLIVTGDAIVSHLYDGRYAGAGDMLKVLAFGLIGARYDIVSQYCIAKGVLRQLGIYNLCCSIAICTSLPLGFYLAGMKGALMAIALSQFAGWPVAMYYKAKYGLWDARRGLLTFAGFVLLFGLLYLLER